MGWVGIGWPRRCKTRQSQRELDNQDNVFFFFGGGAVAMVGGRVRSLARGVDKGNDRITWCLYGKAPMRQLHGKPIAVSGSGYTRKQINSFEAVIHTQESPPQKGLLVGCSSLFMRLARHLTALRAWCKQHLPAR